MSKFVRLLMSFNHDITKPWWGAFVLGMALWLSLAYVASWVTHGSVSLHMNAYDLAEWTTLTPSERQSAVPLVSSLLLRMHMLIIVLLGVGGACALERRWLAIAILVCGSLLQLPPPELSTLWSDVNYRQQILLSGLTMFLGGFALIWGRLPYLWGVLMGVGGVILSVMGLQAAWVILSAFNLIMGIGWGFIMMLVGYGVLTLVALIRMTRQ